MVIKTLDLDLLPDPGSHEKAETRSKKLVVTNTGRFWGTGCKETEFLMNFVLTLLNNC
jgi:hypothetical protein